MTLFRQRMLIVGCALLAAAGWFVWYRSDARFLRRVIVKADIAFNQLQSEYSQANQDPMLLYVRALAASRLKPIETLRVIADSFPERSRALSMVASGSTRNTRPLLFRDAISSAVTVPDEGRRMELIADTIVTAIDSDEFDNAAAALSLYEAQLEEWSKSQADGKPPQLSDRVIPSTHGLWADIYHGFLKSWSGDLRDSTTERVLAATSRLQNPGHRTGWLALALVAARQMNRDADARTILSRAVNEARGISPPSDPREIVGLRVATALDESVLVGHPRLLSSLPGLRINTASLASWAVEIVNAVQQGAFRPISSGEYQFLVQFEEKERKRRSCVRLDNVKEAVAGLMSELPRDLKPALRSQIEDLLSSLMQSCCAHRAGGGLRRYDASGLDPILGVAVALVESGYRHAAMSLLKLKPNDNRSCFWQGIKESRDSYRSGLLSARSGGTMEAVTAVSVGRSRTAQDVAVALCSLGRFREAVSVVEYAGVSGKLQVYTCILEAFGKDKS